jgi:hypothetical protein
MSSAMTLMTQQEVFETPVRRAFLCCSQDLQRGCCVLEVDCRQFLCDSGTNKLLEEGRWGDGGSSVVWKSMASETDQGLAPPTLLPFAGGFSLPLLFVVLLCLCFYTEHLHFTHSWSHSILPKTATITGLSDPTEVQRRDVCRYVLFLATSSHTSLSDSLFFSRKSWL